jgi:hypothetical protein
MHGESASLHLLFLLLQSTATLILTTKLFGIRGQNKIHMWDTNLGVEKQTKEQYPSLYRCNRVDDLVKIGSIGTPNIRYYSNLTYVWPAPPPNGKFKKKLCKYLARNSHEFASLVSKFARHSFPSKIKKFTEGSSTSRQPSKSIFFKFFLTKLFFKTFDATSPDLNPPIFYITDMLVPIADLLT